MRYFVVVACHGIGLFEYIMEIGKIFLGPAKSEMRAHIVLRIQKANPRPVQKQIIERAVAPYEFHREFACVWNSTRPYICIYSKHFWAPDH